MATKTLKNPAHGLVQIRKSNDLVEARYRFDIWETRIFSKMLTLIRREDTDFFEYKIYINELIRDFNLHNDKNSYALVKAGAEKLMRKIIRVNMKDEGAWVEFQTPIIGGLKSALEADVNENSFVKVSFHPDMKPFLLELKERYLVYEFRNVSQLRSAYYVRIYELLKQYQKIGWRRFEVAELKDILGIDEEYKLYGHFKSKVLDRAQENLAAYTDISFSYEEVKRGKSVAELIFYISENAPTKRKAEPPRRGRVVGAPQISRSIEVGEPRQNVPDVAPKLAPELPLFERAEPAFAPASASEKISASNGEQPFFQGIFEQVKAWGVDREVLQLLIETQPQEAILNGIEYTRQAERAGKITENPAGFFIKAVKNRYTNGIFEREKKRRMAEEARRQTELRRREITTELDNLRDEFEAARNGVIRSLTAENELVTMNAILAVQGELQGYFQLKHILPETLTVDDYRQDPILRSYVIDRIQKQNPEAFEELAEVRGRISFLEKSLKELA